MRPARIISAIFFYTSTALGIAAAGFAYYGKYDIAAFCASMSLVIRFDLFETRQEERSDTTGKVLHYNVAVLKECTAALEKFLHERERERKNE